MVKSELGSCASKTFMIQRDNCWGQFKIRYFFWFCSWLVEKGLVEEVHANFFNRMTYEKSMQWCVRMYKEKLKIRSVFNSCDMRKLINESSISNRAIKSTSTTWRDWKLLLYSKFKLPSQLRIKSYHECSFIKTKNANKNTPSVLVALNLSNLFFRSHMRFTVHVGVTGFHTDSTHVPFGNFSFALLWIMVYK